MPTVTPTITPSVTPTNTPGASVTPTPSNTPTAALVDPSVVVASDDSILRKISSAGVGIWADTFHDESLLINSLAIDLDDNIYTASSDKSVRKIDSSGTELWSYSTVNDAVAVAVDPDGNVIIGSFDNKVYKLDNTGSFVWDYLVGTFVQAVAVDYDNCIYFGADDNSVRSLSPTGNLLWSYMGHSKPIINIAVDNLKNVYSVSKDNILSKLNSSGNLLWEYAHNTDATDVTVDNRGNVYTSSDKGVIRKIDHRGILIWEFSIDEKITGISIDVNYNIYTSSHNGTVRKLRFNGMTLDTIWVIYEPRIKFNDVISSPLEGTFPEWWGLGITVTPTPTATVTATQTVTPTATATPTPTMAPSPSPITCALGPFGSNYILEMGMSQNASIDAMTSDVSTPGNTVYYFAGKFGSRPYFGRINQNGCLDWHQTLSKVSNFYDIVLVGGYIFMIDNWGSLIKCDLDGNIIGKKTYEIAGWLTLLNTIETDGTSLFIGGTDNGTAKSIIIKTDLDGDVIWSQRADVLGGVNSIAISPSNIFINFNTELLKLDLLGNVVAQTKIDGFSPGFVSKILYDPSDDSVVCGATRANGLAVQRQSGIMKFDSDLNLITQRFYGFNFDGSGGFFELRDMALHDGGYLLSGASRGGAIISLGNLLTLDTNGDLVATRPKQGFLKKLVNPGFSGDIDDNMIFSSVLYDGTNIALGGSSNSRTVSDKVAYFLFNDDDKLTLDGQAEIPLQEFTMPASNVNLTGVSLVTIPPTVTVFGAITVTVTAPSDTLDAAPTNLEGAYYIGSPIVPTPTPTGTLTVTPTATITPTPTVTLTMTVTPSATSPLFCPSIIGQVININNIQGIIENADCNTYNYTYEHAHKYTPGVKFAYA